LNIDIAHEKLGVVGPCPLEWGWTKRISGLPLCVPIVSDFVAVHSTFFAREYNILQKVEYLWCLVPWAGKARPLKFINWSQLNHCVKFSSSSHNSWSMEILGNEKLGALSLNLRGGFDLL